jgi:2-polyprenyl-3-methyl-5-hydroxy-6-metoxy-1,4-benzoquinol methylase
MSGTIVDGMATDDTSLWRPIDEAGRKDFWEGVHDSKDVDGVSWWQSVPELSLGLVDQAGVSPHDPVIDVGAGWSTLVDHLVARGFTDLTAIDLSATALQTVRDRLGTAGKDVELEVADVLELRPTRQYALWHDRAVYHFLTEEDERQDYAGSLERSLRPGGWLVVATFGPDGPTTCSGLPIVRYTHEELAAQFPSFEVMGRSGEEHVTPWGTTQQFTALLMRRPSEGVASWPRQP